MTTLKETKFYFIFIDAAVNELRKSTVQQPEFTDSEI